MLKRAFAWVLYGEPLIWKQLTTVLLLSLIFIASWILGPNIEHYSRLKFRVEQDEKLLLSYLDSLQTPDFNLEKIYQVSWYELGEHYELATHLEEDRIYFAGKTEKILSLLDLILNEAYEIEGFDLIKSDHKTLLAIQL